MNSHLVQHYSGKIPEKDCMFDQAYRLIRATAAVVRGVSQQVCKVLPEDSVIVVEEPAMTEKRSTFDVERKDCGCLPEM